MNKEEIEKIKIKTQGIMHISYHKLFWNYFDLLQQENKQLKEKYENIISRYRFIKNRVNQGMIEKYKNECLIELGNNILQELESGDSNES